VSKCKKCETVEKWARSNKLKGEIPNNKEVAVFLRVYLGTCSIQYY